ncbi:hypothetical protein ABI59_16165 [Acidobacteria bacterium Mor1]|nr:hypothetical protein ABI59_16165 [Acidobacteria bacterium Mor1]
MLISLCASAATPPAEPRLPLGEPVGRAPDSITALLQDRSGFIWVGSREGLLRYDGYTMTVFDHDVADPTSISGNTIRTIYEDSRGTLWVGTNTGGLNRFDPATNRFVRYRHDSSDIETLSHDSVYAILEDRGGDLWIGTQIGLNRLDRETGRFQRYLADHAEPGGLTNDYVDALAEHPDGSLWIGTVGGGLHRLDPQSGHFEVFRHDPEDPSSISSDKVFALELGPDGSLWIGGDRGLDRLMPDGELDRLAPRETITLLRADGQGRLWATTWGGGVLEIDGRDGTMLARRTRGSPGDDRFTAVLVDRERGLWVGSWSDGLFRDRRQGSFDLLLADGSPDALSHPDSTSLMEDRAGRLWVGTWGRGLDLYDRDRRKVRNFGGEIQSVFSLAEDPDGVIWAGSMLGLHRVDPKSGAVKTYGHDPAAPHSLGRGYVTSLLVSRNGELWIGVGGGGLSRWLGDGRFEHYRHAPDNPLSLSDDYISALYEHDAGELWVGTRSGGLNTFDRETGRVRRHLPDPADENSLSHHFVSAITRDAEGTTWIGTVGGGLNRVLAQAADTPGDQGEALRFERYTRSRGLNDDNIMSVVPDDDGSLWLSSMRGLSRFDPGRAALRQFEEADGLPSGQFNSRAGFRGETSLYFGSSRGVVIAPRGTDFSPPGPSPTTITSVRTPSGDPAAFPTESRNSRITLGYGDLLSLQFAVLDFGSPAQHRYAYRLEGRREGWVDVRHGREVTFTDLRPGNYVLTARGRNGNGVWSSSPPIEIEVVPPFWMTSWFRAAVVLGILGGAFFIHRRRTSALKRRNFELSRLKDQREQAVAEAEAGYARLRRLTRRLEMAKEDERKRIARELHDEMGQGLTAAKINLELLQRDPGGGEAAVRLQDTVRLMDEMIRHVRTLSLDLRPPLFDELGLEAALRSFLEGQSQRSGLDVRSEIDGDLHELDPATAITLFRVVQEGLTNIVRHAGAETVTVRLNRKNGSVRTSIRDDGRGFDVSRALERGSAGHHLGLLGIRERVEGLGGVVDIRSTCGDGTCLEVRVPIQPVAS